MNHILENSLRNFWLDYRSEIIFFCGCLATVLLSTWAGQFIPRELYDNVLTPIFNTCTVVTSFGGAWMLFRRSQGLRARKFFAFALISWGICDLIYLVGWVIAPHRVMDMAAHELTTYELLLGNFLGWVLLLYPTESLRPGWVNWKRAVAQFLPVVVLGALDYVLEVNLWPLIAFYPYILLFFLFNHMHAYREWCEENFSTLDEIDVRWLIRYSIMLLFVGVNYIWMCSFHYPTRGFTQQWFIVVMIIYSTEQILFRKDPWSEIQRDNVQCTKDDSDSAGVLTSDSDSGLTSNSDSGLADSIRIFEQWMQTDKPYLNPDFQLTDLRRVLPTNRSYLSHLINTAYGCSFYHLVNRYRVDEAQRLITERPEMKMADVAAACGFSSPAVFSRTFARETGLSPREWSSSKKLHNT